MKLWEVSNGEIFLRMFYSGDDELIDCNYVKDKQFVKEHDQRQFSYHHSKDELTHTTQSLFSPPDDLRAIVYEFDTLVDMCQSKLNSAMTMDDELSIANDTMDAHEHSSRYVVVAFFEKIFFNFSFMSTHSIILINSSSESSSEPSAHF